MKIVIAPDSYKGAMRAGQVAAAIAEGWRSIRQDDEIVLLPLSDGGEGLCEVLTNGSGGEFVRIETVDALMRQKSATVGISGDTAVIESAEANGIEHLAATELNPLRATTAGVGMLLKEVLTRYRCRKVIIGIGGSATVDGGAGMLQALGVRFYDRCGRLLPFGIGGGDLINIGRIELDGMLPEISEAEISVACDVTNPLCGDNGSAAVFGPQKGALPDMVTSLDRNLAHFASLLDDDGTCPGDGAAGGLGFALRKVVRAQLCPGAALVMRELKFAEVLKDASLVITGEGCSDNQTVCGKLCSQVAETAGEYGVPVLLLSGALQGDCKELEKLFAGIFSIAVRPSTLDEAIASTGENLYRSAANFARFFTACRNVSPIR